MDYPNIAEGFSRLSYQDKIRFYSMAHGSLTELQNQLLISRDVRYLDGRQFDSLWGRSVTAQKLLNGLIRSSRIRSK
ncbi:four helix bundle protein [Patescibacteria group bacterium]|nr:MAG: four helix bundle protein [Patescibacteria group bacterium]